MKNKKAQVSLWLVFFGFSIVIVLISAFAAPFLVQFNTEMYHAGERIYLNANESVQNINDQTARETITGIIEGGLSATEQNIQINNGLFQYGWVFVIALVGITVFIAARRLVEVSSGGLV